jgi:hypothetical protein
MLLLTWQRNDWSGVPEKGSVESPEEKSLIHTSHTRHIAQRIGLCDIVRYLRATETIESQFPYPLSWPLVSGLDCAPQADGMQTTQRTYV